MCPQMMTMTKKKSSSDSSSNDDDADDEGEDGEDDEGEDGEDDKGDLKIGATVFVIDWNWKKHWELFTCEVDAIRDGSYMLTSRQ